MSTRHPRRISRRAAEQLLGGHGGPDAEHDRLAGVLAAAAAPARESELGGEQAAVAAFEAHHLVSATTSRRGQMIKSPLAKLLTAKVIAASVAVFATGGVALAASTGALTGSGSSPGSGSASLPPGPASVSVGSASVGGPARTRPRPARPRRPRRRRRRRAPRIPCPSPARVGLCRALAAEVSRGVGGTAGLERALASPVLARLASRSEFSSLVATVQGATSVPDYCALLLRLPALPQPADLAQLPASVLSATLAQLPAGTLAQVLTELPGPALAQVLTALSPSALAQVLTALPGPALAQVLTALPATPLSQVLTWLPTPVLVQVLTALPASGLGQVLTTLPVHGLTQVVTRLPAAGAYPPAGQAACRGGHEDPVPAAGRAAVQAAQRPAVPPGSFRADRAVAASAGRDDPRFTAPGGRPRDDRPALWRPAPPQRLLPSKEDS